MTIENPIDGPSTLFRLTRLWRAIRWINRDGTSTALLLLLLGACVFAHLLAVAMTESLHELGVGVDSLSLRRVAGIEFIHSHWWFARPG